MNPSSSCYGNPPYCSLSRKPGGSSFKPLWEGSRSDNEFAAKKVREDIGSDGHGGRDDEECVSAEGFVGNGLFDSCCQCKKRKYFPNHDMGWPKPPFLNSK